MEALNAVGLTPLSVLAKRNEPRKCFSVPSLKTQNLAIFSNNSNSNRNLQRGFGVVLLSSFLNSGLAKALTYDEALQQSVGASSSSTSVITDLDISGILDGAINFAVENPLIVGGGAAVLAVPLVVAQLLSKPKPWGVESAKSAYAKLVDDSSAQLLDIRAPGEVKSTRRGEASREP